MKATVLGASGFIGSRLVRHLAETGYDVRTPGRKELKNLTGPLGHVFFCIGMTGNFRQAPFAAVEAHAGLLEDLLQATEFESFLYFSSTRIYSGAAGIEGTSENSTLTLRPSRDTTYDLSKLLGEALCLAMNAVTVRVVRLSNVYGTGQSPNTFLGSLLKDASEGKRIEIGEDPGSSKDYVSIDDVTSLVERIALSGGERIYNIASGQPVRHAEIATSLAEEGIECAFVPNGALRAFPDINIKRVQDEFAFSPRHMLDDLPDLIRAAAGTNL